MPEQNDISVLSRTIVPWESPHVIVITQWENISINLKVEHPNGQRVSHAGFSLSISRIRIIVVGIE